MTSGFEWDPDKAILNRRKHRVSFETAARVFTDPFAILEGDRVEEGELRWQAIGMVDEALVLAVAHFIREQDGEEIVRIISARRAVPKERRRYEEANGAVSH